MPNKTQSTQPQGVTQAEASDKHERFHQAGTKGVRSRDRHQVEDKDSPHPLHQVEDKDSPHHHHHHQHSRQQQEACHDST